MISHRLSKKVFHGELFEQRGQIKIGTGLSSSDCTGDLSHMNKWLWKIGPWVDF